MRRIASLATLVTAGLTVSGARTLRAQALAPDSEIRAVIKARVDAGGATGIVVGVIDPDGRRRVLAYGTSGSARPLDAASLFEIGSVTKTFTAALLADMVVRGQVALDDPVAKYLPSSMTVPTRGGQQITLLDLATQSSGLPRMPTNMHPADPNNPYADYTAAQMHAFVSSYSLPRDVGAEYEYSNLGFGLLGDALARRAGTDYETAVRRRVLEPLGMHDTGITLTPAMRARLAPGHDPGGDVVSNWDFGSMGGAGALRSTMTDMLAYLAANMASDVDSTRGPLARALHLTHAPRRPAGAENRIGLAWHVSARPGGGAIVWHNGATGGYHSFAGYDAARRVGLVILSNAATDIDDIARHLLEPSLPLRTLAPMPGTGHVAVALPVATLDRYVGEYELTSAFHIVVTRQADRLALQATGQPRHPLYAERERDFFLRSVDAQVTFETDASGTATGLVLHQNGRDLRLRRIR